MKILNQIDVITNSSSECFIIKTDKNEDEVRELIYDWIDKNEKYYYEDGEPVCCLYPDSIKKLFETENIFEINWIVLCNLDDPEKMLKGLFGDENVKNNG